MKKLILFGVLAIGTLLTVQAQNVKFGVKGGLNISKLTSYNNSKVLAGFNAGGLVNFSINEDWSIQPELLYSTQGTQLKDSYFNGLAVFSTTLKYDYINIPVMVQYNIVPAFYLEAGPQVGFLTNAQLKTGKATTDIKDGRQTADFGINFGFGYKFDMGLGFGARYNFGLTNVNESDDYRNKNSVAQINLFYIF
ncbi:porin family protein [Chitinophaga sp. 30R24]|uniref:porin family protein n=1 Tax=Chitinophaga sp. 30R24 TaxID=3248838 RepID=UPI003B8F70D8